MLLFSFLKCGSYQPNLAILRASRASLDNVWGHSVLEISHMLGHKTVTYFAGLKIKSRASHIHSKCSGTNYVFKFSFFGAGGRTWLCLVLTPGSTSRDHSVRRALGIIWSTEIEPKLGVCLIWQISYCSTF